MPKKKIEVGPDNSNNSAVSTLAYPPSSLDNLNNNDDRSWKGFARRSTCAAFTHLGERYQSLAVKLTWFITLAVGIALSAIANYYSALSFMNFSGNSEMILTPSSISGNGMEHPKYHICTSSTFNRTILAEMGFVDNEMISYLMLTMSLLTVSPVLIKNVTHQRQLDKRFTDILVNNNITDVSQIIKRALFKCEEIIAGCIAPESIDGVECCAKFFPSGSFASTTGACVTTLSAPPIYQTIPSVNFGFVCFIRDLKDPSFMLDNSIINPIVTNQKGVSFTISDKLTDPTVAFYQEKHYTRIGFWTSLALSKTTIDDDEVAESYIARRDCASSNEPERYMNLVPGFLNYTENNCKYALRQWQANQAIGCHVVTLPYQGTLPSCRPNLLVMLASKAFVNQVGFKEYSDPMFSRKVDCVSECIKEIYSFTATYAELLLSTNFMFGNKTLHFNQSNQMAALNFYFPTFTQTMLVNHYPTISESLGVLGGNVGLFLGASMVTLIEILVFCSSCCRSTARR